MPLGLQEAEATRISR